LSICLAAQSSEVFRCHSAHQPGAPQLFWMYQPYQSVLACHYCLNIDWAFIIEQLDTFSQPLSKPTFLVLDNAPIHKTARILKHLEQWLQSKLYIFYLSPYSPYLNIAEALWRVMKGRWLEVKDYLSADTLFKAVRQYLIEVGTTRTINYASFTTT